MERRSINPWTWQDAFGFVQAVDLRGAERILVISGQSSINADGGVDGTGNMREQVSSALNNLETVPRQADMALGNLVCLNVYTTDMDCFLAEAHEILASRLAGVTYATTYVGVTRLALPDLLVEFEGTAVSG